MAAGSHVGQLTLTLEDEYIVADTTISATIIPNATTSAAGQTQEETVREQATEEETNENTEADTEETAGDMTEETTGDLAEE